MPFTTGRGPTPDDDVLRGSFILFGIVESEIAKNTARKDQLEPFVWPTVCRSQENQQSSQNISVYIQDYSEFGLLLSTDRQLLSLRM